jgi:hypothetical protein
MPDLAKDPMNIPSLRKVLYGYLLLLVPLAWLAMKFDRYLVDGDGVSYMDISDLLRAHRWGDAVNAYWHPLYPACLAVAQSVFHTSRWTELGAFYVANFFIYLLQVGAVLLFVRSLVRLRTRMAPEADALLSASGLGLIGVGILIIAGLRELQLGKIGPDGLLQALILIGLAMLMEALAVKTWPLALTFSALMGASFGLAYLAKSFAFPLTLLAIAVLAGFAWLVQRQPLMKVLGNAAAAFVVFGLISGPYVAALSHQKHRLTFGDSGSLNYAWYVSGTERTHLEPWETNRFGSATVHLIHPEKQLMATPGIYSYKALTLGTYPTWFDTTFFDDRIVPKFSLPLLIHRDTRNLVLIFRYLLNHPDALVLLAVLLCTGASLRGSHRYAWPVFGIGVLMWCIYAMVNIEERYVTAAYFAVVLPVFASLRAPSNSSTSNGTVQRVASVAVILFATLALGEMLRTDLEKRRDEQVMHEVPAWRDGQIYGAAEGLAKLGVHPGDEIACIGTTACLYDHYWARLAGVRILTEIDEPEAARLVDQMDAIPNRQQVYDTLKGEGARVLVGNFDPGEMNALHPSAAGWVRLGDTNFYALPLTLAVGPGQ